MHTIIPKTAATVQPIQSETIAESQIASAASVTAQSTISHELLYVPTEAARIVYHLTDGDFDPGYILLFGKLVGGMPHSDAAAYNLLVVVREMPSFSWFHNQMHPALQDALSTPKNHLHQPFYSTVELRRIEPHDVPLFRLCQGQIASSSSRESLL
ncbi:hypothetical protein [Alistipes dispar]|uniref:hypothetical protein n=1 Tax=Alistipes dispar TaxID=2585119 RepID=UPI003A836EA8